MDKTEEGTLNFYDVFISFHDEGKVTLAAPSEAAAIALVKHQYADRLQGLTINNVELVAPVEGEGKYVH